MRVITRSQLNSPIFRPGALRNALEKVVAETAFDIERSVKEAMRGSKHGRTYRRGRILRAATKKTRALGLREVTVEQFLPHSRLLKQKKQKAIVGYKLHRASAPGEAPAVDTASVINSIRTKPKGLRATMTANEVAVILEEKMNRPAFSVAVEKLRPGFISKVDATIERLC